MENPIKIDDLGDSHFRKPPHHEGIDRMTLQGDVIRLWHELAGPSTPNLKFEAEECGEWNNRSNKDAKGGKVPQSVSDK